jgi:hypothetical protein
MYLCKDNVCLQIIVILSMQFGEYIMCLQIIAILNKYLCKDSVCLQITTIISM